MDRSLDEIIAEDSSRKQTRPSGGRRNPPQNRRQGDHGGVRKVASLLRKAANPEIDLTVTPHKPYSPVDRVDLNLDWVHDKFDGGRDARGARGSRPRRTNSPDRSGRALTKVRVENLHYDITESDLEDLFGRIGPVTALSLVYDRAGRSEGVAYVTYQRLGDAHESIREFDGANAKGQPIRLSLVPGRRERNPDRNTLFDRVERPGRDSRSQSPGGEEGADGSRRSRRSDVSKPAPDGIDHYIPGSRQRSPRRGGGGGRRGGRDGRDNRGRNERGGRRGADDRPRKTQEELDQEMDDYWGGNNAATETAEKQPETAAAQPQAATASAAAPAAPAAADDDIDMIE
ncbi:uncharacterized protein N7458_003190 [Penicillium daleae]|uniref:RRM domain-containing protein n=1 Tax=Penicillium daleae TaxID=63821 RepID=A0AAD6CEK9_9EURO|nr:uncharacterized protein N7458_003190 [Penicillium daleae]KAJ5461638.1 hypothetical protein N7458_003190 [Penicillium daleae]